MKNLHELYVHELKDLYSAETQLVKALPKMADAASTPELKDAFKTHLRQTEGHVDRLEQIFKGLGEKPGGETCEAMQGLVKEGEQTIKEKAPDAVKDAALIAAAQRVEHYEIAGYGTVRTYAEQLGEKDAVKLLQQTLDEEGETDKLLNKLAMSGAHINEMAQAR
jgi:ferritin-like metal-binding protein YciE